jgi:hypothetical protein
MKYTSCMWKRIHTDFCKKTLSNETTLRSRCEQKDNREIKRQIGKKEEGLNCLSCGLL